MANTDKTVDVGLSTDDAAAQIFGLMGNAGEEAFDDEQDFPEGEDSDDESEEGEGGSGEESDDDADDASGDEEDEEEGEEDEDLDEEVDDEDDESEDDKDDGDDAAPTLYKVKVDGEELEVTLDEALLGYQRQIAFQRKTQALAAEKKQTQAERQKYIETIAVLGEAIAATMPPEEPDWEALKANNPAKYAVEYADFKRKQEQLAVLAHEQNVQVQQQRAEIIASGTKVLEEKIPGWTDPKEGDTLRSTLATYAADEIGISMEELQQVIDPRLFILLYKANKYDTLSKNGKEIVDEVKKGKKQKKAATPVVKPGVSKQTADKGKTSRKRKDRINRLRETGNIHDAASIIFDLLD